MYSITMYCMRVILLVGNVFSDPPPPVNFTAIQSFSEIVLSWTGLSDEPLPVTNYTITINGSTVTVPGNERQYAHPISDSECGSTLQTSMSATSAAGTGETTTMNLNTVAARECYSTSLSIRKHLYT